jgi:hypothetical protein
MDKMYYNQQEALSKLNCDEAELKKLVREGKLREFRDSGKLNYRVEEVDAILKDRAGGGGDASDDSGPLMMEDSGEIPLAPLDEESGGGSTPGGSGSALSLSDSDSPIELGGSGSGSLSLDSGSGELKLEDSGGATAELSLSDSDEADLGGESGPLTLEDSGPPAAEKPKEKKEKKRRDKKKDADKDDSGSGADIVSLDEVDKAAVDEMKKDDTVITNIGISVFDDDDLEIAADPMAKTLMTGGDEHLSLDGSGGGSGLLDLTRESDDTSLGAELLEGIDMGDTAEAAVEPAAEPAEVAPAEEQEDALPGPELEPAAPAMVMVPAGGVVDPAAPAFSGLLIAGALVLGLAGAANIATSMDAWPDYLNSLAGMFWVLLGGGIGLGLVFGLVGWFVGQQMSAPPKPKQPREKKPKTPKAKGKKGKGAAAE